MKRPATPRPCLGRSCVEYVVPVRSLRLGLSPRTRNRDVRITSKRIDTGGHDISSSDDARA
jgi:hypothetical protein